MLFVIGSAMVCAPSSLEFVFYLHYEIKKPKPRAFNRASFNGVLVLAITGTWFLVSYYKHLPYPLVQALIFSHISGIPCSLTVCSWMTLITTHAMPAITWVTPQLSFVYLGDPSLSGRSNGGASFTKLHMSSWGWKAKFFAGHDNIDGYKVVS